MPPDVLDRSNGLKLTAKELRRHAGRWVATREGHIVAVADSYAELMADAGRQPADAALFVPPTRNTYF